MGQLNATRIFNAIKGLFSSLDTSDAALLSKLTGWRKEVALDVHDSATAATAFTATFIWQNTTGVDVNVVGVEAVAPIAVTGHAANYATFTVARLDAAGANSANVATFATDTPTTDNMVANVPKTMALTPANVVVPNGYILVGAVAKAGDGVALTAATSRAKIKVFLEPVAT